MHMSDYLESALLNHVLRGEVYTPPDDIYFAFLTEFGQDGSVATDVNGGSYERALVTWANPAPVQGTATAAATDVEANFTDLPQCDVVAVALCDALAGGNILWAMELPAPIHYEAGDDETVALGDLIVKMD